MPLTAAEVRATKFSTTRMRAGYDMDEVDAFLDIIEADVSQYADELQRSRDGEAVLRTQCDQIQARLTVSEDRLSEAHATIADLRAQLAAGGAAAVVLPAPPEDVSAIVANDPEAQSVLAIAQRTADEIVRYAEARAEAVRSTMRTTLTEQLRQLDRKP